MSGHGWVTPNPGGVKVRCGGPGICPECAKEANARYGEREVTALTAEAVEIRTSLLEGGYYTQLVAHLNVHAGTKVCNFDGPGAVEAAKAAVRVHFAELIYGKVRKDAEALRHLLYGLHLDPNLTKKIGELLLPLLSAGRELEDEP